MTPPHNLEAERALLGQILQDPMILRQHASAADPKWFWRPDHALIFRMLRSMLEKGEPIDLITLPQHIARLGVGERLGGIDYVLSLPDAAPSTANPADYLGQIRECYVRRVAQRAAEDLAKAAARMDLTDLREHVVASMHQILAAGEDAGEPRSYEEIIAEAEQDVERMAGDAAEGLDVVGPIVSTGWPALDTAMGGGMRRGKMYIVAGRPGSGKTAMTQEIARNVALGALSDARTFGQDSPESVLFASLEMSDREVAERAMSRESGLPHQVISSAKIRDNQWERLFAGGDAGKQLPVWVWHRPGATAAQIIGQIYATASKRRLRMVAVDYAQIIRLRDSRRADLELKDAVVRISQACAEVGAVFLLCAQFGRSLDRNGGVPTMSALKESGGLEEAAYAVLGLDRPGTRGEEMAAHHLHVHGLKCRSSGAFVLEGAFYGSEMRVEFADNADVRQSAPKPRDDIPF